MQIHMLDIVRPLIGLVAGGIIGLGFGTVQDIALRRNQKLQQAGALNSGWAVMPGSMRRVAYLLVALVVIQILCPLLFVEGTQWWVSGGLVAGYGWLLYLRLCQRRARGI
jgi:hypothetical protein